MDESSNSVVTARRILLQRLQSLQRAGVQQIRKVPAAATTELAASPTAGDVRSRRAGSGDPRTTGDPRTIASAGTSAAVGQADKVSTLETTDLVRPPTSPALQMPRSKTVAAPADLLPLSRSYPTDLPDSLADRQQLLADLNNEVRACQLCRELACTRKQTVFGVGSCAAASSVFWRGAGGG